uniref:Uncharacterized protein n=1 Tax=Romanomermis culicivorax TaxID=13658 RepID=A0A915ILR5_ROMCU
MTRDLLFTFILYSLIFTIHSIFPHSFDRSPRISRSIIADRGKKTNSTENDTESFAQDTVEKISDDDESTDFDEYDVDDLDEDDDQMQDFPLGSQQQSNFPMPLGGFGGRSTDASTMLFGGGMVLVVVGMVVAASMLYKSRRKNARLTLQAKDEDDEDEKPASSSQPTLLKTYNVDEYFASGRATEGGDNVKTRKSPNK